MVRQSGATTGDADMSEASAMAYGFRNSPPVQLDPHSRCAAWMASVRRSEGVTSNRQRPGGIQAITMPPWLMSKAQATFTGVAATRVLIEQRIQLVALAGSHIFTSAALLPLLLEHVPPRLNQGDSRGAKDGRVYRH